MDFNAPHPRLGRPFYSGRSGVLKKGDRSMQIYNSLNVHLTSHPIRLHQRMNFRLDAMPRNLRPLEFLTPLYLYFFSHEKKTHKKT